MSSSTVRFDVAVVGSGFAGSIMAMVLRRLGFSVLLLERGSHPRFVIGESSTPFANLLLETLADSYELPMLRELSEFGRWRRHHPELPVGLKRGFTFYHHRAGQRLDLDDRANQLLVAASPNDDVADTHWYRPDFDQALVREAERLGAVYLDHSALLGISRDSAWRLETERGSFAASFVVDASGGAGSVADLLGVKRESFASMPPTRAVFAHFTNVPRLHEFAPGMPYPADDAAVHHVFDGGWIWVLRFNNGLTSAGAALRHGVFPGRPEESWHAALKAFPTLQDVFGGARPATPFYEIAQVSFRRSQAALPGLAVLPSAAAFVDPLLSTGFALALLGIVRLGEALRREGLAANLEAYGRQTLLEAEAVADLIGALYAKMDSFGEFSRLTLLYFAALSYTETCWRLGKPEQASAFLLANDPEFDRGRAQLCGNARAGSPVTDQQAFGLIERLDIAGLTKPSRRNWHPVDLRDLIDARLKVGASIEDLLALFRRMKMELPGI